MRASSLFAAALALVGLAGCSVPPDAPPPEPDGGTPLGDHSFGEPCTSSFDCATGICIAVGGGRSVCTRECEQTEDCGRVPGWGCVPPRGYPRDVCACSADASEELCGDGLDNDCNGRADDCRLCDGVPTAIDDPQHCGECGNACRDDQFCDGQGCVCASSREIDCGSAGCINPDTNPENCGTCGNVCTLGRLCLSGSCECTAFGRTSFCAGVGCVDTDTDPQNCGACGRSCAAEQECVDGDCVCPVEGQTLCGDGCVDLLSDEQHCGECGRSCPAGQECTEGECACPGSGLAYCGGACVDLTSDARFCGSCGVSCLAGEACVAGECVCASGVVCGNTCKPVDDATNCGACGRVCGPDQTCSGGECQCKDGQSSACGPLCVDLTSDEGHCGECAVACRNTESCIEGECICESGATFCEAAGSCVDLASDEQNCGACGETCGHSEVCLGGECTCPDEAPLACAEAGRCVDPQTDEAHCGGCGITCNHGQICADGACTCPASNEAYCASEDDCVDIQVNEAHCGACDAACPTGATCSNFACRCTTYGLTPCEDGCTNVAVDEANCGACGVVCHPTATCTGSACVCPPSIHAAPVDFGADFRLFEAAPPRAATNGSAVAIVHDLYDRLQFGLRNLDGTARTPLIWLGSNADGAAAKAGDVAYGAGAFGVVYAQATVEEDGGVTSAISFARFDGDGNPIGSEVEVATGSRPRISYDPILGFVVAYETASEVEVTVLGDDGASPAAPFPVDGGTYLYDIATSGSGELGVIYAASANPGAYVYFVWVLLDGSPGGSPRYLGTNLTTSGFDLEYVSGLTWAAVHQVDVPANSTSRVVLRHGSSLGSTRVLGSAPTAGNHPDPQLAIVDTELHVVWWDGTLSPTRARFQRFVVSARDPATTDPLDEMLVIDHGDDYIPRGAQALVGAGDTTLYVANYTLGGSPTITRATAIATGDCP